MAALYYILTARDSTAGGTRVTGLMPTWVFLAALSSGSAATQPSITEIGDGQYKFEFDAESQGECSGQIDLGSSLSQPADRYVDVVLTRDSSRIQTCISSGGVATANAVSLPSPAPAGYGGATGTGTVAVNHNSGGTDAMRLVQGAAGSPAGVFGATVTAYLQSDFNAGNTAPSYYKGQTTTDVNGRWVAPLMLSISNVYVIVFAGGQPPVQGDTAIVTIDANGNVTVS